MRILFLSDDFPPQSFGGAGISTYDLALGMKEAGHEVFVITTCRKESEAGEMEYHGLKISRLASAYSGKWRSYLSLYNPPIVKQVEVLLKKIKPEVVHINNVHFYLSYHCFKLAKRYAPVVVFTARDVMSFNFAKLDTKRYLENFEAHTTWLDHLKQAKKRWNPFRNLLIRKYLDYADQIFAVSFALKKALEQNGIKNVEVMHSGADVGRWQAGPEKVAQFRSKYNLENKKVILFGGRLSRAKGGQPTLESIALLAKNFPYIRLLVVSRLDEFSNQIKEEAVRLGIEDKLIFMGWIEREEIKEVYACADIVLVPSLCFDAFPRIVLEAMASGKPVIGTCYGGASEVIIDGVTGYIINPFAISKLAEKISDLLKNPQKAKEFGQAGRERIRTHFDLENKVKQFISYYQQLSEKKSRESL